MNRNMCIKNGSEAFLQLMELLETNTLLLFCHTAQSPKGTFKVSAFFLAIESFSLSIEVELSCILRLSTSAEEVFFSC